MSFVEVDLFGVYVSPMAMMLVVAYAIFYVIRWIISRLGWLSAVWHPGLVEIAVYLIILSTLVLAAAQFGSHV